jgi:hypothetical protein
MLEDGSPVLPPPPPAFRVSRDGHDFGVKVVKWRIAFKTRGLRWITSKSKWCGCVQEARVSVT